MPKSHITLLLGCPRQPCSFHDIFHVPDSVNLEIHYICHVTCCSTSRVFESSSGQDLLTCPEPARSARHCVPPEHERAEAGGSVPSWFDSTADTPRSRRVSRRRAPPTTPSTSDCRRVCRTWQGAFRRSLDITPHTSALTRPARDMVERR